MSEVLHGRESETKGPAELVALWKARPEKTLGGGEYVPWQAVWVDPSISPRDGANTDKATVERYAEILDDLPAIEVQRDTFRLIDGKHRLEAAASTGSYVRIFEVDAPDNQLFELSYLANTAHGRPLTDRERANDAKRIWDAKVALGEKPNQAEFSRKYQVSRRSVVRWTSTGKEEKPAAEPKPKAERKESAPLAHIGRTETPLRRVPDGLVQWSEEEHPVAYDDDGEADLSVDADSPIPGVLEYTAAHAYQDSPEAARLVEPALKGESVLQAIEAMSGFEDSDVAPGDFLTLFEGHPLMHQLNLTDFQQASAWLGKTSRFLRVGRED